MLVLRPWNCIGQRWVVPVLRSTVMFAGARPTVPKPALPAGGNRLVTEPPEIQHRPASIGLCETNQHRSGLSNIASNRLFMPMVPLAAVSVNRHWAR